MTALASHLPLVLMVLAGLAALLALGSAARRLFRLAARTGVGLALLALLNQAGGAVGIHLGLNLWNALVLGVLGIPGFGLLLLLNWVLRI
ncbi:pro-sigmaK processing inhibitor BofA family protein [Pseudoflavonifractor phocaeensis]|uniref:pro-sigmaK processing inhibitor BofA family protein n=1 Tax=Pseudoflavonifractor phocaeensis TaxID=1870988 RepID=UPI001958A11F|nr:pro-sigmaK processing inhibitor BofA family protein [Pseudoflavonifractor phocaeensis]MBM6870320.1 pro-sigmaK processing inhibitor BofA family protein [Pseudoflavonifractor phocaeensis]